MKEFITPFAKGELVVMIDELKEDGATFLFIANKTGVSIHKLRRLMNGYICNLTPEDFSSITKFYAKNCINSK